LDLVLRFTGVNGFEVDAFDFLAETCFFEVDAFDFLAETCFFVDFPLVGFFLLKDFVAAATAS
jgi:hypothetical protein